MKTKCSLLLLLALLSVRTYGADAPISMWDGDELGFEVGGAVDVTKIVGNPDDFSGSYHFGFSEMESSFFVEKEGELYRIRHESYVFDEKKQTFLSRHRELTQVEIKDGYFDKDGWKGRFVFYFVQPVEKTYGEGRVVGEVVHPTRKLKGLVIEASPVDIRNELGFLEKPFRDFAVAGQHAVSHDRLLTSEDVKNRSRQDLALMRNEIFARYGYRFSPGGEMDRYFKSQPWYKARYEEVSRFFNDVEKKNVRFLRAEEKRLR